MYAIFGIPGCGRRAKILRRKWITEPVVTGSPLKVMLHGPRSSTDQLIDKLGDDSLIVHRGHAVRHGGDQGHRVLDKIKGAVPDGDAPDRTLRQAQDVSGAGPASGGPDPLEDDGADGGGGFIDRLGLTALHIGGMTVRIAEIHAVDHQGHFDPLHPDVLETDIVHHGDQAAAAPGLDPQAPVIAPHPAVVHPDVADSAGHFAADGNTAVTVQHGAPGDFHILGGHMVLLALPDLSGLNGDAVVPHGEQGSVQLHSVAALGIETVRIGAVGRSFHRDIEEAEVIAEEGMDVPERAVAESDPLDGDIPAALQKEQMPPIGPVLSLGIDPPDAFLRAAVNNALPDDSDIFHVDAGQGRGKGIQRISFLGSQQQIVPLAGGEGYPGQNRETILVGQQGEGRALFQLQGQVTLQKQGAGQIITRRKHDPAAFGAAHDGCLNAGGVICPAVSLGAETADVQGAGFRSGTEGKDILFISPLIPDQGIIRIRGEIKKGNYRTAFLPQGSSVQRQLDGRRHQIISLSVHKHGGTAG